MFLRGFCRLAAGLLGAVAVCDSASAQAVAAPQPILVEEFDYGPDAALRLAERWIISGGLHPDVHGLRVAAMRDPIGRSVGRFTVEQGDALSGATEMMRLAKRYVCDLDGSKALEMEAEPGGVAPTERAEIQWKYDRKTGDGEIVRFGEPVWYRFAFKVPGDWPRDVPINGRPACRTVIHQIKQDSFKAGVSCSASPFFKIETRPLGETVRFFAQIVTGSPCSAPEAVVRRQICVTDDLARDAWHRVNVRLYPAQDASGRADLWIDGAHCGTYLGPMGDPQDGARRNGMPAVNAQPRFGIYRDWRAETQTIYFDQIMFWHADPTGHPAWAAGPVPTSH
jgi:hypothetical protein